LEPFQGLSGRTPTEKLAILNAIDKKRRDENFVKYWQATPPQAKIFEHFTQDIKTFGVLGGNRSGKTEFGAFISVAWALGKEYFIDEPAWEWVQKLPIPPPPVTVWVVGLDFPTLRDVIWGEKLRFGKNHSALVPKDPLVTVRTNDAEFLIHFANGSKIIGKSAESGREKFQSASVDLVWIDEEPEVEIYDECYQRTADCSGKILLTLTPLIDVASGVRTPWVFDLYQDWKAGQKDVYFSQLSVLDNPYIPELEKEKLKDKWAGHFEEKARLYGEFIQKSGLVYPMWNPDVHMIDPIPVPANARRIVSIDPAATGTTAAVASFIDSQGDIYIYNEYYEKNQVVSEHAKRMQMRFGERGIDLWLIDPKWSSQRLADSHKNGLQLYRDAGIPVRPAEVGQDYGMNESREYLNATIAKDSRHPKVYIFNTCKNFRWEMEHYTWAFFEKGEQKGMSKDKPMKKNDHLMNAFQYLCAMQPRGRKATLLQSAEQRARDIRNNSYTVMREDYVVGM
jgi:phage terminase large subunit-like protein